MFILQLRRKELFDIFFFKLPGYQLFRNSIQYQEECAPRNLSKAFFLISRDTCVRQRIFSAGYDDDDDDELNKTPFHRCPSVSRGPLQIVSES